MRSRSLVRAAALVAAALLHAAPSVGQDLPRAEPPLKTAFDGDFLIGASLNLDEAYGRDTRDLALLSYHFNSISPENLLKWSNVHPEQGRYAFEAADRYVAVGERNGMFIVGHTLVWHSQTPRWVFEDLQGQPVSRDTLLSRMRQHIHSVVGRYRGRIKGWDVVNEALNENGTLRQSPWLRIIGEDYIEKAFQYAHEADPQAELYYNDYSLERPEKRAGAVRLVQRLQAAGVPIAAVGIQGHHNLAWPSLEAEDSTISAFASLGLKVAITELDIDVLPRGTATQSADVSARPTVALRPDLDPYTAGLPDQVQRALADRYAAFFDLYRKHRDSITRVTFWNVTDQDSWLNNFPIRGRTNHPLLFDRAGRPKPAFHAVVRAARAGAGTD
jgi:endo-1,4-beta-xylanase